MAPPASSSSQLSTVSTAIDSANVSNDIKQVLSILLTFFDTVLNKKNEEVEELKSRVSTLEAKLDKLEADVDTNDAYERRDTLIVSGNIPPATDGENCNTIIRKLLSEQCQLNIQATDISTAHRLGVKPKSQGPDKRNIIFKLCRRDVKEDILNACRQSRPPFFINCSLTPTRNKILFVLRKAKAKFPEKITACRSINGSVSAFVPNKHATRNTRDRRIDINTPSVLASFLQDHIETSMDELLKDLPRPVVF